MEREYTWREFTQEDLWTATIWVWSFLLLVVLVLVNIFLAMVFDTYGDVRSSVGSSATLWQTTKIVATHMKHTISFGTESQKWIPNRQLVQAVKGMRCQYVTPWMVKDAFPGISNQQVNYIFNLGKNRMESMLLRGNKSSLPAVVASILLGIERMLAGLQMMERNSARTIDEYVARKAAEGEGEKPADTPRRAAQRENVVHPPNEPPAWLKVQLLPHFQKQQKLLGQVHKQIEMIERTMECRGQSLACVKPTSRVAKAQEHAVLEQARNALSIPVSPRSPGLNGASGNGMMPAALRAGLTMRCTADSPRDRAPPAPAFSQPGG